MNLRLEMKDIGPIRKGSIEVDDLTVIVGANSSGKSLISKSAYVCLRSLTQSLEANVSMLREEDYGPEGYKATESSSIELFADDIRRVHIGFDPTVVSLEQHDGLGSQVTYVDGPLVINEEVPEDFGLNHNDDLKFKLVHPQNGFTPTGDQRFREINNLLDQVLDGHVMSFNPQDHRFYLRISEDVSVPARNAPNGIKTFLILKTLFNHGYLTNSSILILDEPEIVSHPSWQLDYAHILLKLVKYYGLKLMVNSCGLYFIEALEMYAKSYKLDARFYLGQKDEDGFCYVSDKDALQKVYGALMAPYERLDDLRLGYAEHE